MRGGMWGSDISMHLMICAKQHRSVEERNPMIYINIPVFTHCDRPSLVHMVII